MKRSGARVRARRKVSSSLARRAQSAVWKPRKATRQVRRFIHQLRVTRRYVPDEFYADRTNRLAFADYVGEQMKFTRLADWYSLRRLDIRKFRGELMLRTFYGGSVIAFVSDLISNSAGWHPWLFGKTPSKFWQAAENRTRFFEWLKKDLGLSRSSPEAWYGVDFQTFMRPEVKAMLKACYRGPSRYLSLLKEMHPSVEWCPWLFRNLKVYGNYWGKKANRVGFIHWYTKRYLESVSDWDREPANRIIRRLAYRPFRKRPLIDWLREAYPDRTWNEWTLRAGGVPDGFWRSKANRLKCLRWLEEKKQWTNPEHWYTATHQDFNEHGVVALLRYYPRGSTVDAACELHPSLKGKEWLFERVPENFWADIRNQRRFLRWLEAKLGIGDPSEWYLVTGAMLRNPALRGHSLLNRYNQSIYRICCAVYPRTNWNPALFKKLGKIERLMQRIVRDEIGDGEAFFNYLHPDLRFMRSGRKMELDVWFPERMLAIEYQGEYHDTPRGKAGTAMADLELRRQMDAEKRAACAQAGITLIEIWHHQVKDRHDIIRSILREALSGYKAPVSLLMPHPRATG
jgi:hypothetical protein